MRPRLADRIAAAIADDPTPENVIPFGPRCTLLELTSATCRFPIGDPRAADFAFCGARPVPGVPYCIHHARIAYTPAIARRREPLAKASGLTLRCGGSRSAGWP
jgi:GcrA cell cycle regulator